VAVDALAGSPFDRLPKKTQVGVEIAEQAVLCGILLDDIFPPTLPYIESELKNRGRLDIDPPTIAKENLLERFDEIRRRSLGFSVLVEAVALKPFSKKIEEVRHNFHSDNALKRQYEWFEKFRAPYLLARLIQEPGAERMPAYQFIRDRLREYQYLDDDGKPIDYPEMPKVSGENGDHSIEPRIAVPEQLLSVA